MTRLAAHVTALPSRHTQLSYQVPHSRVHCCEPYPRPTPTSPEIVVYGHENGLTVLYRASGDTKNSTTPVSKTASPHDFGSSYTIYLGVPVLSLSFPPPFLLSPPDTENLFANTAGRKLLCNTLVLACATRDRGIHVISLPLTPPTPETPHKHQILTMGSGASTHQTPPTSISLTLLPNEEEELAAAKEDIVLATTSRDSSGLLLLWRVPITNPRALPHPAKPPKPYMRLTLHSAPSLVRFSTCASSLSRRHQLLVVEDAGVARVYNLALLRWCVSLYTPVSRITDERKHIRSASWCVGGFGIVALLDGGEWGLWDLEGTLRKSQRTENADIEEEGGNALFLFGGVVGEDFASLAAESTVALKRRKRCADGDETPGSSVAGTSMVSGRTGTTWATAFQSPDDIDVPAPAASGSLAVLPLPGTQLFARTTFLRDPATRRDLYRARSEPTPEVPDEAIALQHADSLVVIPSLRKFWKSESLKTGTKRRSGREEEETTVTIRGLKWGGARVETMGWADTEGKMIVVGAGVRVGVLVLGGVEGEGR